MAGHDSPVRDVRGNYNRPSYSLLGANCTRVLDKRRRRQTNSPLRAAIKKIKRFLSSPVSLFPALVSFVSFLAGLRCHLINQPNGRTSFLRPSPPPPSPPLTLSFSLVGRDLTPRANLDRFGSLVRRSISDRGANFSIAGDSLPLSPLPLPPSLPEVETLQ